MALTPGNSVQAGCIGRGEKVHPSASLILLSGYRDLDVVMSYHINRIVILEFQRFFKGFCLVCPRL